jgi:hypothetical protein
MFTDRLDHVRAACAEFPNDNPALHRGALWFCAGHDGALSCERPHEIEAAPREARAGFRDAERSIDRSGQPAGADCGVRGEAPRDPPEDRSPEGRARKRPVAVHAAERCPSAGGEHGESGDLAVSFEDEGGAIEIVDELAVDDPVEEGASTSAELADRQPLAAADGDPFARLVQVLDDAARGLGAGPGDTSCLRALFGFANAGAISPGERAVEALLAGNVLVRESRGLARTNGFSRQVLAWQGILRGESEDFGVPGDGALEPLGPLDEWSADIVARVVGNPARADGIRRELRRRGVAAFGLVADAA